MLTACHWVNSEGFGPTHHHLYQNPLPLQGDCGANFAFNALNFQESPSLSRCGDSLCGNGSKNSLDDSTNPRLNACHWSDSEDLADDRSSSSLNDGDIIVSRLRQCTKAKAHNEGRHLHANLIVNGFDHIRFFGNLLIEMFGQCRSLNDAHCVFSRLSSPNLYSWTLLIKAYAENGDEEKALQLYAQMKRAGIQPDEIAFITILGVCGNLNILHKGWNIHAEIVGYGFQMDTLIGNALIDMYGKCKSPHDALLVCNGSAQRNVITWSALINACVLNGLNMQALYCFERMLVEDITPDKIAFASILGACTSYESQETGRCIHANVVNTGFEKDVVIGNALINMYGKCGVLDSARLVFDKMHCRNIITWTSIMMVYAQYGLSDEVLLLLSHMMAEGIQPDEITYVAVLTTCSHEGLLNIAKSCFASMDDRGVMFMLEHFVCLVDLLGRAGQLDVADGLLKDMPFVCNAPALLSYLSVCRIHGDLIRGLCVANAVLKLDPENISSYTHLMYFSATAEGHEA